MNTELNGEIKEQCEKKKSLRGGVFISPLKKRKTQVKENRGGRKR